MAMCFRAGKRGNRRCSHCIAFWLPGYRHILRWLPRGLQRYEAVLHWGVFSLPLQLKILSSGLRTVGARAEMLHGSGTKYMGGKTRKMITSPLAYWARAQTIGLISQGHVRAALECRHERRSRRPYVGLQTAMPTSDRNSVFDS